jgi:hypothetical protein
MLLVGGQPDARVRDGFTCTVSQLGDLAGQWLEATGTTSDWVVRPLQLSKDAAQVRPRSGDSRAPAAKCRIAHGGVTASLTTCAHSCSEPRGRYRVVALIVAEEFQYVWSARNPGSQDRAGVHRVRPPSAGECAPATSILTIRSSVLGSSNVAVTDAAARQPTNRESRATVLLLVDAAATRSDALV